MECAPPPHPRATINQDAVDAVDLCVAEFAAMVTNEAAKQRKKEMRGVLSVGDLIKAMEKLGYDHYVGPLIEYLFQYRESKGNAAAALRTVEMGPQPPYDFMARSSQVLEAAAVTGGLSLYDLIDPAPAAAAAVATREMTPQPSDFAFVQPLYDFMAQGPAAKALAASATEEIPLARGELGLNTAPSTSVMPPAGDDE
ncbi:hypothetical protein ACQ4PT_009183 [Festuca glaucescens]